MSNSGRLVRRELVGDSMSGNATTERSADVTFADMVRWTGAASKLPAAHSCHGVAAITTDSRTATPGSLFVALRTQRDDGHRYVWDALANGALAALVAESWRPTVGARATNRLMFVKDPLRALQQAARKYRRELGVFLIAVTGSSGKTTTRTMIHGVLGRYLPVGGTLGNLNNHIGVPVSLLGLQRDQCMAVIEMGASHRREIHTLSRIAEPDVAVITNIGYSHIGLFGSLADTTRAKLEIADGLERKNGFLLVNGDDRRLMKAVGERGLRGFTFGTGGSADLRATGVKVDPTGTSFSVEGVEYRLEMVGRHFVYAALPAIALALWNGLPADAIREALLTMVPARMRGGTAGKRGVRFVLDCYNANPSSMRAGLELLADLAPSGRRLAVLGDMLELGHYTRLLHRELGRQVAHAGVREVVLVGEYADEVAAAATTAGMPAGRIHVAADARSATPILRALARSGDTVLLKASRRLRLEDMYAWY